MHQRAVGEIEHRKVELVASAGRIDGVQQGVANARLGQDLHPWG